MKSEECEREDRLRREEEERRLQLERIRLEDDRARRGIERRIDNDRVNTGERNEGGIKRYDLGLGKWNPDSDLQGFINRFEITAHAYELPDRLYAIELAKCLEGPALLVYETLSPENRLKYEELKKALLKRFKFTESGFRKRFQNARTLVGESQKDFVDRLYKLFNAWCELGEYENSTEGISEMVIKDVYFRSQPIQVQTHLKEMGRMSLREMAQKAEYYREAHNIHGMKEEYNDRRGYKLWQSRSGEYEVGRNRTDMHERRNGTDTYRFTVNPFGLRNAGAVYCRLMRMIMQGANNVGNYVYDVIAHDKNVDCHIDTLKNLFQRLREANVKVKPSKARLGYFKLEFLGFVVGSLI